MNGIIYLDNAATTFPKPQSVLEGLTDAVRFCGGNPGRGSHVLADRASELVFDTREVAARMFGARAENVVFTVNATHALNYAIKGLARRGGHILIDSYAHNASYRPAAALRQKGITTLDIYDASGSDDATLENLRRLIKGPNTIVIATHQSNISSKVLPIHRIGELCAAEGCAFVVDASQSAGHIPINIEEDRITSLCMPGHKGLYGIMGAGMLISSPEVRYNTLIEGGAGVASLDVNMPDILPERLEAGTVPLPAIAALKAGMEFVSRVGEERIHQHEASLAARFTDALKNIERIRIHGECGGSVVGLTVDGIAPADIGEYLDKLGICVRTGYHCAPVAHRTVGTIGTGSVRFSFSYFNTSTDADRAADAMRRLCTAK